MANYSCNSCDDLRTTSPNFVVNGITDTECTSLQNNTGINPSSGHNDCTDLNNINDCLVGNMAEEIEAYDVCDWKTYMKKFVPNVWTTFKAIICAICGLWTNVELLMCQVKALFDGTNYVFTRDQFIEGTGVTMVSSDPNRANMTLRVKGNVYRVHGSVNFDHANWTNLGLTNSGGSRGNINTPDGNYLIGILKIKKSDYPEINWLYDTTGAFTNAGVGHVTISNFDGDADDPYERYYPSQWGWTDPSDHTQDNLVPPGYIYVNIRLAGLTTWGITNSSNPKVTIDAIGMASMNRAKIEC